jgi:DDE superfamily endonuclease
MVGKSQARGVVAAYFLLFGRSISCDSVGRHSATRRSGSRRRDRQRFCTLESVLSLNEFTRALRMTPSSFWALLSVLERDLTRDEMMAARSSGGRVEPAIRLALTIRILSGASYLGMMMLFRIAKSTVYEAFHSTIASITKRLAMPGLPSTYGELQRIAQDFAISRQPLNPLQGCVGAVDGICIEIQKPADEYGPRDFYCRKGMHAIPAQAVVDAKYRFLYLSAKCAGSTPDAIAWESSSLGMRLRREPLPLGYWLAVMLRTHAAMALLLHGQPDSCMTTRWEFRGMRSTFSTPP